MLLCLHVPDSADSFLVGMNVIPMRDWEGQSRTYSILLCLRVAREEIHSLGRERESISSLAT